MGTLFIVATPIGNLEDITARALRVLKQVNLIAAEDTRRTRILLDHYRIKTRIISYHEYNKIQRLDSILEELALGDVALVSDAGTPVLNDPGYELVKSILDAGHEVSPIPGPSAPIAALVASGLPCNAYLYLGYLPRKVSQRHQMLEEIAGVPYTLVFLESPQRILPTLEDLVTILGDRQVAVARELTKLHEEIFRGSLGEAYQHYSIRPPRGEFTLVIAGNPSVLERWSKKRLQAALKLSLAEGQAPKTIAKQMSMQSGWSRREIYNLIHVISPGIEENENGT